MYQSGHSIVHELLPGGKRMIREGTKQRFIWVLKDTQTEMSACYCPSPGICKCLFDSIPESASGDSRTSWLGSFNNESLGTPGLFCF